jgi:hypothetical protein
MKTSIRSPPYRFAIHSRPPPDKALEPRDLYQSLKYSFIEGVAAQGPGPDNSIKPTLLRGPA